MSREALSPSTGVNVVHLFCRLTDHVDSEGVIAAVKSAQADGHQVVTFAVLGHKADLGFLSLGPDQWRLRRLQADLQAAGLDVHDSYVSVTEVSEYAKGMPEQMLSARLYPNLPPQGKRAICFYPMSKRRGDKDNWYTLPYEKREELMRGHGATGRT